MTPLPDEWLRLAHEDLLSAEALRREKIWNHVCFHAQQAVEKGLKALLEMISRVEKIHDSLELAVKVEKLGCDLESFRPKFEFLNQFYTSTRYPFLIAALPEGMPGEQEADLALDGLHAGAAEAVPLPEVWTSRMNPALLPACRQTRKGYRSTLNWGPSPVRGTQEKIGLKACFCGILFCQWRWKTYGDESPVYDCD